jgi:nitroreductase
MPELLSEIASRRSFRAIDPRPVDQEVLRRTLEAATLAPSCFNNQPWRFLVLNEEPVLSKIKEHLAGGNYWVKKSPVVIAVVTRNEFDCALSEGRDYAMFDCGMAAMNLQLQAWREGLYAHPMAGFSPKGVKEAFGMAEDILLITLIALGYPGSDDHLSEKHRKAEHSERSRRAESEVIFYNEWPDAADSE